jgi:MFS family permease
MDTVNQKLPRMAAALVPRELATWSLTAVALGALEGGLLGVIVKNQFAGVASPIVVNFAVAVVAAAPSFSNLASFLFASMAAGRDKLALLGKLMLIMGACLVVMALPGHTAAGLAVFCVAAVLARTAWSGILVVRAAVWRANYVRAWRARVTARIVKIASLLMAAYSALIGVLLDWRPDAFRPAFIIGGASALIGASVIRKSRLRRQRQLKAAELAEQTLQGRRMSLKVLVSVLRRDIDFRHYMVAMMVMGSGNLMTLPMLVILLNERLHLNQMQQVMVISSLPLLVFFFSVSHWALLLDRRHIFSYRAFHSWFFAAASLLFAVSVITEQTALLWPASVILGGAFAGGSLGWNLGHNDFSNDGNASHYMAIHVTLTGLRGLVMPLIGVGFYEYLSVSHPEYASWVLLLPFTLTFSGALIFVFLHLQLVRRMRESTETG